MITNTEYILSIVRLAEDLSFQALPVYGVLRGRDKIISFGSRFKAPFQKRGRSAYVWISNKIELVRDT